MAISINGIGGPTAVPSLGQATKNASISDGSFQKMLGDAIATLNSLQAEADSAAARLAAGDAVELHEVLLATERANLAFQLAMQVRNKVIEAYQEIMRMQV